jgi:hypothetical protein
MFAITKYWLNLILICWKEFKIIITFKSFSLSFAELIAEFR